MTCLLKSDPNDVENTSNPDYWLTTNSIQQENGRETANCIAARSTTIPSTLPPRRDEIFTEDRVKGNAVLFLEWTLQLVWSVRLSYYSHHQQSGCKVEPEHYGANRGVKGPQPKSPLSPQDLPPVFWTNFTVIKPFRHFSMFRTIVWNAPPFYILV